MVASADTGHRQVNLSSHAPLNSHSCTLCDIDMDMGANKVRSSSQKSSRRS